MYQGCTPSPSNNEMQLTGGEGGAHAVLERRARVVTERRPQLISVFDRRGEVSQ